MTSQTFIETEALLKVLEALDVPDDNERVDFTEISDYLRTEFLPTELRRLAIATRRLADLAWTAYDKVNR